jgi:hypothetical protein
MTFESNRTEVLIGTAFRYEMLRLLVTPPINSQYPGLATGQRAEVVAISERRSDTIRRDAKEMKSTHQR